MSCGHRTTTEKDRRKSNGSNRALSPERESLREPFNCRLQPFNTVLFQENMKSQQILSYLALFGILLLILMWPVKGQQQQFFQHNPRISVNSPSSVPTKETNNFLETFSLSFAGNLNFANAMEGVSKILEGISSFIDLDVISATVDVILDRFLPILSSSNYNEIDGPISRMDVNISENEDEEGVVIAMAQRQQQKKDVLKDEITTVVGAILNKQQCWSKTACVVGSKAKNFAAKDVLFILAEKFAPEWKSTLDLVKKGAVNAANCQDFSCTPEKTLSKEN